MESHVTVSSDSGLDTISNQEEVNPKENNFTSVSDNQDSITMSDNYVNGNESLQTTTSLENGLEKDSENNHTSPPEADDKTVVNLEESEVVKKLAELLKKNRVKEKPKVEEKKVFIKEKVEKVIIVHIIFVFFYHIINYIIL